MRLSILLLALCSCGGPGLLVGTPPPTYVYTPGVELPDTAEAQACKRQCMPLAQRCDNYDPVTSASVIADVGPYSRKFGCPGVLTDCLLTCPGARLAHEPAMKGRGVEP